MRKYKARFCARGDLQINNVDVFDTYAPVVSWATVRSLLAFSLQNNLSTKQVDFSNAFVHAELPEGEDIYVEMPATFNGRSDGETIGAEECVLKHNKSLYGLKQAPLLWCQELTQALKMQGFTQATELEPCMFFKDDMVVLVYVDDCLFFPKDEAKINDVIESLRKASFTLTVEEDVYAFLGIEVERDWSDSGELNKITPKQPGLINKVLASTKMQDCNAKETPASTTPLGTDRDGPAFQQEAWEYASVVGMLLYLTQTRPDIQYAVHQVARFAHCPWDSHSKAIYRILRYLKGTADQGIEFVPEPGSLQFDCFVDADFAGLFNVENAHDPICSKSRTGYSIMLGKCPVVWVSKLQHETALSTTESEYIALSMAMRDLLPLRGIVSKIAEVLGSPELSTRMKSTVWEDNNGCIAQAKAPQLTARNKHYATKYHFFRSHIGTDPATDIVLEKVGTEEQIADMFTKGLDGKQFCVLRKMLMGW